MSTAIVTPPSPRAADGRYLWGAVVALGLVALVVLGEIDTLSGQVVAPLTGFSWPLGTLFGWRGDAAQRGWAELLDQGVLDGPSSTYGRLLLAHLVTDVAFVVSWALVLTRVASGAFRGRRSRSLVLAGIAGAALADLAEDVFAALLLVPLGSPGGWLADLTQAKWVLLAVTLLAVVVRLLVPAAGQRRLAGLAPLRRAVRAAVHHRFSTALAVPLLVLSVLPGSPILEQLPDAQRAWVADGWRGLRHLVCAVLALGGAAGLAEVFGRYRTGYARRHGGAEPPPVPSPAQGPSPARWWRFLARRLAHDLAWLARMVWASVADRSWYQAERAAQRTQPRRGMLTLWVVGPALALLGAAAAALGASTAPVLGSRLAVFCLVPLLVAATSWVLRTVWEQLCPRWNRPDRPLWFSPADVSAIAFAGHAIPLAILTIGGLGLLRSFTSMALIAWSGAAQRWTVPALLAAGAALAVAPWLVAWWRSDTTDETEVRPGTRRFDARSARLWPRWALLGGAVAAFVLLGSFPFVLGGTLGVAAVATIAIGTLVSLPATAGLLVQERPTAEVFRLFGFRRTPLISVMVVTVVLVGLASGRDSINTVTPGAPRALDARRDSRPAFAGSVARWAKATEGLGCTVEVAGRPVRPMLLVAAEGGGIRAAYWTVGALQKIVEETPPVAGADPADPRADRCGAHATLFSGGASGGSVGLTVARFSGTPADPGAERAVAAVRQMAGPSTLAAAVVGTFDRDPLYGATGVPVGADGLVPARSWADRARLIELGWSQARAGDRAWGEQTFLADPTTLSPVTGQLILNSSTAATQCRVWVSQVRFSPNPGSGSGRGEQSCDERRGPAARTIDLFSAYGPFVPPEGADATCLGDVSATTGALLTARFPYVTPGGVVGDCPTEADAASDGTPYWPRSQLVDGGYLENTGLGTVVDLAPDWTAQVRDHNQQALASGAPLVVPIVVYLANGEEAATRPPVRRRPENELLVPPLTIIGGAASMSGTEALLQRASAAVSPDAFCPEVDGVTAPACTAVAGAFPRRVVVVNRTTQPEVSAPLGWVLSRASTITLERGLAHAAATPCLPQDGRPASIEPACRRGYASLADLTGYLKPR